jgi:hypothetical protein
MKHKLLFKRVLASVLLVAVIFAPAPGGWEETSKNRKISAGSLAARILGPTFDQGLIGEDIRPSFSALGKRRDVPNNSPLLPIILGPLLLAVAALAVRRIPKPFLFGCALLKTRAPPLSI